MGKTESETLLPCPFCGGAPRKSLAQPKNGPESHAIGCSQCPIVTEWMMAESEAIAAWNARVAVRQHESSQAQGLVEALRTIDGQVSHALMGDWSIALKEIRTLARAALAQLSTPTSPEAAHGSSATTIAEGPMSGAPLTPASDLAGELRTLVDEFENTDSLSAWRSIRIANVGKFVIGNAPSILASLRAQPDAAMIEALTCIADMPHPGEEAERSATFYSFHIGMLKQIAARGLGRQTVSDAAVAWAESVASEIEAAKVAGEPTRPLSDFLASVSAREAGK